MSAPVGSILPPSERPFGKYELVAKLAMGGMAEIFLARENEGERKGKLLVIKRVLPHLTDDSRFIAMFRDEARLASRIIHPNVCQVFDSGTVGHLYFMAMEYLHGVPLSRMLLRAARTKEPIPIPLVVGIVAQCCDGLEHAHNLTSSDGKPLDVVHRDISPPNIFVTADGLAKILDFGVAKARGATQKTRTGTVKGKNSYMSPEQILGKDVDRRSDVFSLGIVLWEALAAKRLFSRDTDFLTFRAITESEIPGIQSVREDVSDAIAAVVDKSLARDREERYASAAEMAEALRGALEGAGDTVAPESVIAADIKLRFSKELSSKSKLTTNITDQLQALPDGAAQTEGFTIDTPAPAGKKAGPGEAVATAAVSVASITAQAAAVSPPADTGTLMPEQDEPSGVSGMGSISYTDLVPVLGINKMKKWIPLAVFGALVLVLGIWLGSSGGGESESAAADVDASTQVAATPIYDASPPPPDAAVALPPDAAVDAAVPKVDKRPAYLTVDSHPYATIYVDGKRIGVTPIFKKKLAPGPHTLRAVSATGAKQRIKLNLKPGRTKNLGRLKWK